MEPLKKTDLPSFFLFKNLVLEDPFSEDSPIISYDWAKKGTLKELQGQIPQPVYPQSKEKIKLFIERFGDVLPEETNEYYYDDTPANLGDEVTDVDVFGESFTIMWVTPANKQVVIDGIVNSLKEQTKGFLKEIDEDHLYYLWTNYIDRILIYSPDQKSFGSQIVTEIKEELPRRISKLPNPPTEVTWDTFEQMLL